MIGNLRHRVSIQTPTTSQNEFGEVTNTWATSATVWAEVRALSGREAYNASQVQPDVTHKVTLRFRSITSKQRLLFGSSVLEILSVIPDVTKTFVEITAVERI